MPSVAITNVGFAIKYHGSFYPRVWRFFPYPAQKAHPQMRVSPRTFVVKFFVFRGFSFVQIIITFVASFWRVVS
jgi:hypothetical protein